MNRILTGMVTLGFVLAAPVAGCAASETESSDTVAQAPADAAAIEQAQALLTDFFENNAVPIAGFSVTIRKDGNTVFNESRGVMNLDSQASATPQTRYRIYSTSKPLTAAAAMRLAEQGRLDLDAPIGELMPDLPDHIQPITARQLMGHRSGIRHYRSGEWVSVSDWNCPGPRDAMTDFINDPLEFEPGTDMAYSTFGFVVLSAVIETAAGESYDDAMRHLLFEPAGMTATAIEGRRVPGYDVATFYLHPDPDDPDDDWMATADYETPIDASCKFGGGGFVSTSEDLARFGQAMMDGTLVSAQGVDGLTTVVTPATDAGPAYGRGFFDGESWLGSLSNWILRENVRESVPVIPDTDIWFHGGSAAGGYSMLFVYPEYDLVATLASTNALGGNIAMVDLHEIAMVFADIEE